MDVWCKAFCCRHINFKTVFHSASEHAIFIQKTENFLARGLSHDPIPVGASTLRPPFQNPKYATICNGYMTKRRRG